MSKYTPDQVAKAIGAAVTGLTTIGAVFAQALADGKIVASEWSVIIPAIVGAVLTVFIVFMVPNGLQGDSPEGGKG